MDDTKPSKSEQKRRQLALQAMGEQLIDLPDELLEQLSLTEAVREAITDIRKMKSHEAVRRQKQYIGKLMREVDPAPIQALLDRLQADKRREQRLFSQAERWRDRLLREGQAARAEFESSTGRDCAELESLLAELDKAHSDRAESHIRKQIFRVVHAALVAQATDG